MRPAQRPRDKLRSEALRTFEGLPWKVRLSLILRSVPNGPSDGYRGSTSGGFLPVNDAMESMNSDAQWRRDDPGHVALRTPRGILRLAEKRGARGGNFSPIVT